jgi:hypothetical protein
LSRGTRPPGADGCWLLPLFRAGAVGSRWRILTAFPDAAAVSGSLHHTRLAALSPGRPRGQRAGSIARCGLDTARGPHAVRRNGARHGARAPVRCRLGGGAAPVHPGRLAPQITEPERVSHQRRQAQGGWPMRSCAVMAAGNWSCQRAISRLPPGVSRAASGSRAPLTTDRDTGGSQRPCDVVTWHRPHGLRSGPRRSTRCPGQGSLRVWSETVGRRDGPGEPGRRLLRTPRGERRGPSWCPRSRPVYPPLLGRR